VKKLQELYGDPIPLTRIALPLLTVILLCLTIVGYAFYPISSRPLPRSANSMAGIYPTYPKVNYGSGDQAKLIKRGEYIAKSGDCLACHTNTAKKGQAFAGGLPIKTPFGTFYSPNITPDEKNGIGKWSLTDFARALRSGRAPNGSNYFPVFPYAYYNKLSDQDVGALFAYLKVVPKANKENQDNEVPFPFNVRFFQYFWKALFFYPYDEALKFDPTKSPAWNRGAYLVEGPGHCAMCHTPINSFGGSKRRYHLTGAFVDGYWAPNITGEGLQDSSTKEIVQVFKEDVLINDAGQVAGPMRQVNHDSLQFMTDKDLFAIATYLKSVKSRQPLTSPTKVYADANVIHGKAVYFRVCAMCHAEGLAGAPRIGDEANWFKRLSDNHLNGLYRHSTNGYNNMPVRGGCTGCSDRDIESAVLYMLKESLNREQYKNMAHIKPKAKTSTATAEKIYNKHCSVCHNSGDLGAPKIGDKAEWAPRIKKNMDVLIHNTMVGSTKKPAKGGCKYCSTSEVIAAIKYMVNKSKTKGDYSQW